MSTQTILFYCVKCIGLILMSIGIFSFAAACLHLPSAATVRTQQNLIHGSKDETSPIEMRINSIAKWLSKFIHIDEFKREQLLIDLKTAQMDISPEMYKAKSLALAGIVFLFSIPFYFIFPFIGIVLSLTAVFFYVLTQNVKQIVKEKREAIEADLPRLVATIQKKLSYDRSITSILQDYLPVAGEALRNEIEITIADINSGNEEAAITRLEARIGSPLMSDVCRGFITMIHGDVADVYWATLSVKLSDIRRQKLKEKALKIPKRVDKLSIFILVAFIVTFFVVVIFQIIGSADIMF